MKNFICLFLCLSGMFISSRTHAQSVSLPTDPDRVQVVTNGNVKTIVNGEGEVMRGGTFLFYKSNYTVHYEDNYEIFREELYKEFARYGINAIRVYLFDGWVNSQPDANSIDFTNPAQLDEYLERLDTIVDFASKYNMTVLLNYHDVGNYTSEYGDPDATTIGYMKDCWNAVAPYFKDRTNVFYELMNEPVFDTYYSDALLDSIAYLYQLVRDLAPNTHISLFSFNTIKSTSSDDPADQSAATVERFTTRHPGLVDWTNASVAYHPYATGGSSSYIFDIMENYPAFCSEGNFPKTKDELPFPLVDPDEGGAEPMDNELFTTETHERLGISWFMHKVHPHNRFVGNFVNHVIRDASEKNYIWFHYTLTDTLYKNYFTGTTVNSDDFTWHTDGTTGNIAQNDELIITNAGHQNSKIVNELSSGKELDLTKHPFVSFKAKTDAEEEITYTIRLYDSQGGNSGMQFSFTIPVKTEYTGFAIDVSGSSADLSKINKIEFDRGSNATVDCKLTIDDLVLGREEYIMLAIANTGGTTYPEHISTYKAGRVARFEARPDSLYSFYRWDGANTSTDNKIEVTMNENKELTAYFTAFEQEDWYIKTPTSFINFFTGSTLNSEDFTWSDGEPYFTEPVISQQEELIVSKSGEDYSKFGIEFESGTIDISSNPVVSFQAKTDISEDIIYAIELFDNSGGRTYGQFKATITGDGQYHAFSIDLTGSWADLKNIEKIFFNYQKASENNDVYEIRIDNLSAGIEINPVNGVNIIESGPIDLDVGASTTLTAEITPSDASNQSVTWTSGNPEIAIVDENGQVTAVSNGSVEIRAFATTDHTIYETITVNAGVTTSKFKVHDTSASREPSVFPNPFYGKTTLVIPQDNPVDIYIYNSTGQLVKTMHDVQNPVQIDMQAWPRGLYFIRCISGQESVNTIPVVSE